MITSVEVRIRSAVDEKVVDREPVQFIKHPLHRNGGGGGCWKRSHPKSGRQQTDGAVGAGSGYRQSERGVLEYMTTSAT